MYILYAISKYIFRQVIDGIEFRNQRKFSRRPSNTSEEHGLENSVFEVGSGGYYAIKLLQSNVNDVGEYN